MRARVCVLSHRFVKVPERFLAFPLTCYTTRYSYELLGAGVCITLAYLFLRAQKPQTILHDTQRLCIVYKCTQRAYK